MLLSLVNNSKFAFIRKETGISRLSVTYRLSKPLTAGLAEKVIMLELFIVPGTFHPYGFRLTAVGEEYFLKTLLSKLQ